jgi:hypothetical protein
MLHLAYQTFAYIKISCVLRKANPPASNSVGEFSLKVALAVFQYYNQMSFLPITQIKTAFKYFSSKTSC